MQCQLLQMLYKPSGNITVVGDDDQSIYNFNGSRFSPFLSFFFFSCSYVFLRICIIAQNLSTPSRKTSQLEKKKFESFRWNKIIGARKPFSKPQMQSLPRTLLGDVRKCGPKIRLVSFPSLFPSRTFSLTLFDFRRKESEAAYLRKPPRRD